MNVFVKFIKADLMRLVDTPEVLSRLKEQILQSFLLIYCTLGGAAILLATVVLLASGAIGVALLDICVYLIVLLITFYKKIPYNFRVWIFLTINLITGLLALFGSGLNGNGQLVLIMLVALTVTLLGIPTALIVSIVSVGLFLAAGWIISSGAVLPAMGNPAYRGQWMDWTFSGLTLFVLMLAIIAAFMLIYRQIQLNIGRQLHQAREIEQERMGLEWQVRERTQTLQDEIIERKKIEDALRESETKYRSLLAQLPVGIYRTTLDGVFLHANPALASMLGFETVEDLIAHANINTFYEQAEDRKLIVEKLSHEKGVFSREVKLTRKDGVVVWVKNTGRAIANPSEHIMYIDGIMEDITEQKKAREALQLSEQRLALHIQKNLLAFIEWNLNFEVLAWNPSAENMFGYKAEEALGKRAVDLIFPGNGQNLFVTNWQQMLSQQDVKHDFYENIRKDGRKITCEWFTTPLVNAGGQMIGIISQVMNISERVQVEKLEKALYRIAETANNTENLLELYVAVHGIISDLIPAKNFFIALYDSATETLEFPYYVDEYDPPPPGRYPLGNGLTDYVIRTGKPLLAYPQEKEKLKQIGDVDPLGTNSVDWVGVPLITASNRVMGALAVQTYTQGQRYSLADIDILSFVSTQIAMVIERKKSDERLKYLSTHDVLTGLFNRNFFETEIERLQSSRYYPISILVADVDNLKQINDHFGHISGDNLLKQVARLFKDAFRSEDIISRIGGDEFAVLLPQTDEKTADEIVVRLRKMMGEGNKEQYPSPLFVSIGMSTAKSEPLLDILKLADNQMYLEKTTKKKRGTGQLIMRS